MVRFCGWQELAANRLKSRKVVPYVADSPDLFVLRLTANEFWELVGTSYDMSPSDYERETFNGSTGII